MNFPHEIDLKDYILNHCDPNDIDLDLIKANQKKESHIYELYAISNHYGGMGGGHYTAYAKNHFTQKWYDFNDSSVSECGRDEKVVSAAAYVLFYQRK